MKISTQDKNNSMLLIISEKDMRTEVEFTMAEWSGLRELINAPTEIEIANFHKHINNMSDISNIKKLRVVERQPDGKI